MSIIGPRATHDYREFNLGVPGIPNPKKIKMAFKRNHATRENALCGLWATVTLSHTLAAVSLHTRRVNINSEQYHLSARSGCPAVPQFARQSSPSLSPYVALPNRIPFLVFGFGLGGEFFTFFNTYLEDQVSGESFLI